MNEEEKIITYSKEIFLKNGFYKITMDELAKGLRISKKTIYKHFPSKDDLINCVISDFQKNIKEKVDEIIFQEINAIIKMKSLSKFFAELSLRVTEKLLFDLQTYRPDLWILIDNFRSKVMFDVWSRILNQGKDEEYIIDIPNDIVITIILSSLRGIINPEFLLNHSYSMQHAFNTTFDILIKSILTSKGLQFYKKLK